MDATIGFDKNDRPGSAAERFQADGPRPGKQIRHFAIGDQVEVFESLEQDLLEQIRNRASGVTWRRQDLTSSILSGHDPQRSILPRTHCSSPQR